MTRGGGVRLAVLVGAALVAVTGCSSGADGAAAGSSSGPSSTASVSPTTAVARPMPPAGWSPAQQGRLAFALPPGFTQRPEGAGMPGATAQWTKTDDPQLKIPPAVAVFVETGNVGPLEVRTQLVTQARTAELGAEPAAPASDLQVPGSTGAKAVEWRWDYDFVRDQPPVPSRQVEIVVQTTGPEQYGLLLGGPVEFLTDDVLRDFEASIAVVAEGSPA